MKALCSVRDLESWCGPYGIKEESRRCCVDKKRSWRQRQAGTGWLLAVKRIKGDHVSGLIYGKIQGSLTTTNQAPVSTLTRFKSANHTAARAQPMRDNDQLNSPSDPSIYFS
ncbi:hypothetical protein YC2023_116883 [Brassica napus]